MKRIIHHAAGAGLAIVIASAGLALGQPFFAGWAASTAYFFAAYWEKPA